MKVIALKDFDFYILPKVVRFKKGQLLDDKIFPKQRLQSMINNGYAKSLEDTSMENKMLRKYFKNSRVESVESVDLPAHVDKEPVLEPIAKVVPKLKSKKVKNDTAP